LFWPWEKNEQWKHTLEPESHRKCLPFAFCEAEVANGVTGNECAPFVDGEMTLFLRDRWIEVEGLSKGASDEGVLGTIRPVLSMSWEEVLVLMLLWGSKVLIEDLTLAEFGLGGSPLVEPGLDRETEGPSVFAKVESAISKDHAGICSKDRLGRLDWGILGTLSPSSFPVHLYNVMPSK